MNSSLAETRTKVREKREKAGDDSRSDWKAMQDKVAATFDSLHAKATARNAASREKHAESVAADFEWEAEDAVDFAAYAVQEAECAVLQAAIGRHAADDLSA